MGRTVTRDWLTILLDEGGVEFPAPEDRDDRRTATLVICAGSTATTGLHWHEDKTEYLQILQGHALITLGTTTFLATPSSGTITIPRFTVHQYGRADTHPDTPPSSRAVDLRVLEWTDPADGGKESFFRNEISLLLDGAEVRKSGGLLGRLALITAAMTIMWHHDNYPAFLPLAGRAGEGWRGKLMRGFTHVVVRCVAGVGWVCGFKGSYPEYTPKR